MKQYELLDKLIKDKKGIIRTSDATNIGITKTVFYNYTRDNKLQRVSHGVYTSLDSWLDPMYILHLRSDQIIFSHESALFLHDLTDSEPIKYVVTVKTGYNPSLLTKDGVKVYTIKEDLYTLGLCKSTTTFGNTVITYDMERTICDLIRSKSKIEIQTFQDALKQYSLRKDKDLRTLMKYAKLLHVEDKLKIYLEVLL